MIKDVLGQEIRVGDYVAQIKVVYNTSNFTADIGIITEIIEEEHKLQLVTAKPIPTTFCRKKDFLDEYSYNKFWQNYKANGGIEFSKRKVGFNKVIKISKDKSQEKLIKKYEKASGKKLY